MVLRSIPRVLWVCSPKMAYISDTRYRGITYYGDGCVWYGGAVVWVIIIPFGNFYPILPTTPVDEHPG